jgi:hypothetical protein
LKDYLKPLNELLMSQTSHDEEQIRLIVAESLGRLFSVYPTELMTYIHDGLQSGDARKKATIAKSVKYSGQKSEGLAG